MRHNGVRTVGRGRTKSQAVECGSATSELLGRRRGRQKKRVAVGALLAGSALLFSACGSTAPSSSAEAASRATASSKQKSVDLGYFFWTSTPEGVKVWTHDYEQVEKLYPYIHIHLTTTTWTDYWEKLPLEAATGSMPCLAGLQYGYVGSVGKDFIPLNSLIKKYHYSLKPFEPTMIRELSVNSKLIALPYDFGPIVIAYNKNLFKAKGVADPKDGWTWAEFLSDAKKLTGKGDYGFMFDGISESLVTDLTGVEDAFLVNGKFDLTNAAFERGVQLQAELHYKYHVTPAYSTAPNYATDAWDTGKMGMTIAGPWDLDTYKELTSIQTGWVELPRAPGRSAETSFNEGSGFGITKDCPASEIPDAFKALTGLVDSNGLSYAASVGRAYPARLADDPIWSRYAGEGAGPVMAAALKLAKPEEVTTNWTAFETATDKYDTLVLNGTISAAKYAHDVQADAGPGSGVSPGSDASLLGSGS